MPRRKVEPAAQTANDDLVVALPPEILAMMAAAGADVPAALAQDEAMANTTAETADEGTGVSLPPEILAMMAAAEADASATRVPLADEAEAALPPAPMPDDARTLALDPVLDITAAAKLHTALLEARGAPLVIDAGAVKRLGGQCLQLLLSAGRTFAADNVALRLGPVSESFRRDLALFGLLEATLFQPLIEVEAA